MVWRVVRVGQGGAEEGVIGKSSKGSKVRGRRVLVVSGLGDWTGLWAGDDTLRCWDCEDERHTRFGDGMESEEDVVEERFRLAFACCLRLAEALLLAVSMEANRRRWFLAFHLAMISDTSSGVEVWGEDVAQCTKRGEMGESAVGDSSPEERGRSCCGSAAE